MVRRIAQTATCEVIADTRARACGGGVVTVRAEPGEIGRALKVLACRAKETFVTNAHAVDANASVQAG